MFNIYLLDPYWSQKKRILYTPFFWHSIGWVEIFVYSFSFERYESDIDRVIYLRSSIVTFWWSEIQIDVSSHSDEAKSKSMYRRILMKRNQNRCIVAFWWSEIQIDRRIVIERNSNRSSHCDWAKYKSMYHRILMAFIFREVGVPWIVMNLVERRWVCRISLLLRAKTSMSSLASRAKMSMSNLAIFGLYHHSSL